jgi:tryptophan synthase alpha subunit
VNQQKQASTFITSVTAPAQLRVNRLVQQLIQIIKGSNNQTKGARFAISPLQNVSSVVGSALGAIAGL